MTVISIGVACKAVGITFTTSQLRNFEATNLSKESVQLSVSDIWRYILTCHLSTKCILLPTESIYRTLFSIHASLTLSY